jgi:hypothetical protein
LSLKTQDNLISTIVLDTLLDMVNKVFKFAEDCQKFAVDPVGGLANTIAGVVTLIDESWTVVFKPKTPPSQATEQLANAFDTLGDHILILRILNDPTIGCREVAEVAIPPHASIMFCDVMVFTVPVIENL